MPIHWQPKIREDRLYVPFRDRKPEPAPVKVAPPMAKKLAPIPEGLEFTNKVQARAFELINDAAENGLAAPTNDELGAHCHLSHANSLTTVLRSLALQGHIRTEKVNGCSRKFTVLHSGKTTLTSGKRAPAIKEAAE